MNSDAIFQVILAVVAITPGVLALYNQWRTRQAAKEAAERDDKRDDFSALFDAAKELGEAGSSLVEPLTQTIEKLRSEMRERDEESARRDRENKLIIQGLEQRLTAAEARISEVEEHNLELLSENERLSEVDEYYRRELLRLAEGPPAERKG